MCFVDELWRSTNYSVPGHLVVGLAGRRRLTSSAWPARWRGLKVAEGGSLPLCFQLLRTGQCFHINVQTPRSKLWISCINIDDTLQLAQPLQRRATSAPDISVVPQPLHTCSLLADLCNTALRPWSGLVPAQRASSQKARASPWITSPTRTLLFATLSIALLRVLFPSIVARDQRRQPLTPNL